MCVSQTNFLLFIISKIWIGIKQNKNVKQSVT